MRTEKQANTRDGAAKEEVSEDLSPNLCDFFHLIPSDVSIWWSHYIERPVDHDPKYSIAEWLRDGRITEVTPESLVSCVAQLIDEEQQDPGNIRWFARTTDLDIETTYQLSERGRELYLNKKKRKREPTRGKPGGKRGPKPKNFLRRHCVEACYAKGLEQAATMAAFEVYQEECNFEARALSSELNTVTGNIVKHDLAWLRKNTLPELEGDDKAEFQAFKKWLKDWRP